MLSATVNRRSSCGGCRHRELKRKRDWQENPDRFFLKQTARHRAIFGEKTKRTQSIRQTFRATGFWSALALRFPPKQQDRVSLLLPSFLSPTTVIDGDHLSTIHANPNRWSTLLCIGVQTIIVQFYRNLLNSSIWINFAINTRSRPSTRTSKIVTKGHFQLFFQPTKALVHWARAWVSEKHKKPIVLK